MKKAFIYLLLSIALPFANGILQPVLAGPGQPPVLQVLDGSLGQLNKDSFNIVSDTLFFDAAYNSVLAKPYLVRNTLVFRINPYSPYYLKRAFTATIRLEVTVTASNGSTSTFDTSLTVKYNKDSLDRDRDSYLFSNGYRVKIKVLDRQTNADWDVWKSLTVENELQSFPAFIFDCSRDTILSATHAVLDSATTADELPVSWSNVAGADEYDLEWTYIDSSALNSIRHLYGNAQHPDASLIFDNSSSRVTVTGSSYNIPIFYDGTGTLFFRVRPVQLRAGGGRTEGHWTSDKQDPGRFYFKGHERRLNWQSTASFAEEGKRKVVVQYYDGSLRGRQTVTKDNTTNTTLVSESFYDYQGRPVIQVLPAPTFSSVIKYSQNFNLGLNGAYDKNDFDSLFSGGQYCNSSAAPMGTDSGAARYYSRSNPDKDTGIAKYIPDAQGYPFTEVEYVQDNTGRISRQSGVGINHRLGSGHETKYYYGSPDQHELDALFGTEVGDRSHYFKTMVRDANGQYSVSYTDMHGRTIATALAGVPDSAKLDTLSSYRGAMMTETLSDVNSNVIQDLVIESKKGLLVQAQGLHEFIYSLNPASLQLADHNNVPVCYDCLYDLDITITDDCGNNKVGGGQPYVKSFRNFSLGGAPDTTCGRAADPFSVSFSINLAPGSYEVTKRLSISRYGESWYRDSLFMKRNAWRTQHNFLDEQRAIQASNIDCVPSCASCTTSLGTWPAYYNRFITQAGIAPADSASYRDAAYAAYKEAQDACKLLCDQVNEADDLRQAMLLDMTAPSGQYANPDSAQDPRSIFYEHTVGANDTVTTYSLAEISYLDEEGHTDSVYDETSGLMVKPQKLSERAFSDKFKLSWAEALLPYHPEYCKLQQYEAIPLSPAWDKRFGAIDTYAEAISKGYLNPTQGTETMFLRYNATGTADYDPLATTYGYKTTLENKIKIYQTGVDGGFHRYTLWQYATAAVKCKGKPLSCIVTYNNSDSAFNGSSCGADLDMEWRMFRQMYLDMKRSAINANIKATAPCTAASPSATSLLAAGHQPRFGDAAELAAATGLNPGTDTAAARSNAEAVAAAYYDANCRSYVTLWWQALKGCYSLADSAVIIPRLIEVCKEGADASHPYGASSVRPGSTNQFSSFEEVIDNYNSTHGISGAIGCNAYGITAPKPYDQQTIYSVKPLWTAPNQCECDRIASLYKDYQAVQGQYLSFSDYMYKSYLTSIPDSTLTALRNLCLADPAAATCNYLATPIQLPAVLQCNAGNVCVGSTQFKALDAEFRAKYPGMVPVSNPGPGDSAQLAINKLYEDFMNYRLGFSKTVSEYLTFLNKTNGVSQGGLDSLQSIMDDYNRLYYPDTVSVDTVHFAVGRPFQDNVHLVTSLYPQIFANGVAHIPPALLAGTGQEGYLVTLMKNDTICVNDNFTLETRIRSDSAFNTSACTAMNFVLYAVYPGLAFSANFNQAGQYRAGCGIGLWTCNGGCSYDTVNSNKYLIDILDWVKVRMEFRKGIISLYANDTLIRTTSYPTAVNQITKMIFSGGRGYMDYIRVYDSVGVLQYAEEFEDSKQSASNYPPELTCNTCEAGFTGYFNQRTGKSYAFTQIDSLYKGTGTGLNVFCIKKLPGADTTATLPATVDSCSDYRFINTFSIGGTLTSNDVVQTADDGYLMAGGCSRNLSSGGTSLEGFIIKVDKKGQQKWANYYGGAGVDDLVRIRNTADGGFIAVGNTTSFSQSLGEPFLVKGNADGSVQWSRTLGSGLSQTDQAVDVIQTSDGGYVVAASYNFGPGHSDWELIRLNSSGGSVWAKKIGTSSSDGIGGILEDGDSIVVSGYAITTALGEPDTGYNGLIAKVRTSNGNLGWVRAYDIDTAYNWFSDIQKSSDGYFINSLNTDGYGSVDDPLGHIKQVIVRMDSSGYNAGAEILNTKSGQLFGGRAAACPKASGESVSAFADGITEGDIYFWQTPTALHSIYGAQNRVMLAGDQRVNRLIGNRGGNWIAVGSSDGNALIISANDAFLTGCHDTFPNLTRGNFAVTQYEAAMTVENATSVNTSRTISPVAISCTTSSLCYNDCTPPITDSLFLCGRSEPVFSPVAVNEINNCSDSTFFAVSKSTEYFKLYTDSLLGGFDSSYRAACLEAYKYEQFTVRHAVSEYHHTLYYYDQAGNLIRTVPPAGVHENYDSAWLESVAAARAAGTQVVPAHGLLTQYRYNTLNQVIAQQTPDAGRSRFWYDRLGRLAISQNARQRTVSGTEAGKQYSYTLYDAIGRITEVGQIANGGAAAMTDSISRSVGNLDSWLAASQGNKEQITQTVYDMSYAGFTGLPFTPVIQRNLRNRVAYTTYTAGSNALQYSQGTFYTYDIEGNVDTLLQDYGSSSISGVQNVMNMNGNRFKRLVYRYDLVSGKVNGVAYQPQAKDAFYHRYTYDAENRLTGAETSSDSVFWEKDARYGYYKHGPLAREVIGDRMVQGLDYAYTLQGWLKGVNSMSLTPDYDMGRDGDTGSRNRYIGRDVYGFGLNYYAGDYAAIGTDINPFPGSSGYLDAANYRPLYNGNIASMGVNLGPLYRNGDGTTDNSHWRGPLLYNYKYDQLNRITRMDGFYGLNQTANNWAGLTVTKDFKERVSYDGNGNIQKYLRNNFGETGLPMDSLGYQYTTGTNQLSWIRDSASDGIGGGYDLHSQKTGNYQYDSIGNLIRDSSEHISAIRWNVYGKITEIDHDQTTTARPAKNIYYYYDAAGNRIGKKVTRGDTTAASYTWYVRDASGNVMATYTASLDTAQALGNADLKVGEQHLYGSSRLGILNAGYSVDANTDGLSVYTSPWTGTRLPAYSGNKQYELSNHLGNVLATVTDRKIGVSLDSSLIDHYEAEVLTSQDYYPFGMVMPGRMYAKLSVPGGSVEGQTRVNGYAVPVDLTLNNRGVGGPSEYTATSTIDLEEGFETGVNDDVTAYLADGNYAGTGNGGSDAGGLAAGQGKYRYGFNGQEKGDEIKGTGNSYTAAFWEYDPRIGRRWNLDPRPVTGISQYSGFNNSPVWFNDPLGDTLSNPQLVDAIRTGYSVVQTHLETKTFNIGVDYSAEVYKAVLAYGEKNKLNFGDFADFQQQALDYYKGFKEVGGSYGGGTTMNEYGNKILSLANQGNEATIIRSTQALINSRNGQYGTILQQTMRITPVLLDAPLRVEVGAGPRGPGINSKMQQAIVNAGKPALRQAYETEVTQLKSMVEAMRGSGATAEEIARTVSAQRRVLGVKYKDLTPTALRETIYNRNIKKYGDPLGPTVDWLRAKGKSWDEIIESATRSGGQDINFNK